MQELTPEDYRLIEAHYGPLPPRISRPPWQIDGEDIFASFWEGSPKTESARAQYLVDNVFVTQSALASRLGCTQGTISKLINGGGTSTWEESCDGPKDRLWYTYNFVHSLNALSSKSYLTLPRSRFFVPPEQYDDLLKYFRDLRADYSRWTRELSVTVGECLALCQNDYSCWTDQVVPSWNLAVGIGNHR
jgi:hypothetical protein